MVEAAANLPLTEPSLTVLEQRLLDEMAAAWQRGERLRVEDLLGRHPILGGAPDKTVRLIHEEIRLRRDRGESVDASELLHRFPRWRQQLGVMLECQALLRERLHPGEFPAVGQALGDFLLLAELGRGAHGRVYLAIQQALAGRPVVLKVTPRADREFLSLGRLQHTHIIPLYGVYDFPELDLHALCMPYLGGASLAGVLSALRHVPTPQRRGAGLIAALEEVACGPRLPRPGCSEPRQFLSRLPYPAAIAWIGACLADALDHAHERGLVHLDLKPSNVLLAADGQPFLLDFHLAHAPLRGGQPVPFTLGGTHGYMSPEQQHAYRAACDGLALPADVDHRSDLYSLGRLLLVALGGDDAVKDAASLERLNPQVSSGLADILRRCLATDPGERYASGSALAADLRRHLEDRPLQGVANRSLGERWSKWRRRRPHAPLWAALVVTLLALPLAFAGIVEGRARQARASLDAGRQQLRARQPAESLRSLRAAQAQLGGMPLCSELRDQIGQAMLQARRAAAADHLHEAAQRVRFLLGALDPPEGDLRDVERSCAAVAEDEPLLKDRHVAALDGDVETRLRADLAELDHFRRDCERRRSVVLPRDEVLPASADHATRGRALLRAQDWDGAAAEFARAAELRPQDFWSHFHGGVATYRAGRPADAVHGFTAALALAPDVPEVLYNRAIARAAADQPDAARRDLNRAIAMRPALAPSASAQPLLARVLP